MRALTVTLFFAQLCLGQTSPKKAAPAQQSPTPVFAIAVDVPPSPVHLDAAINVNITVTNVSGKDIWWEWDRTSDTGYKAFAFLLTKGERETERTFFGRKIGGRLRDDDPVVVSRGSLFPVVYPPGKMFTMTIDVRRLYEIKEPGVYTLYVSRYDQNSKTLVRSNILTLKIEP